MKQTPATGVCAELLACPFCGQAPRHGRCDLAGANFGGEFIECSNCGASTNLVFPTMGDVKRELVERWNRRDTAPATPKPCLGKLIEMGELRTCEMDGNGVHVYPMALLITFESKEAIRKAIADGICKFTFGDEE